jgi:dihydroflavonol-4-reductase
VDESRPLVDSQHSSPYERSKAAGEQEVRRAIGLGLNGVILSPTAIIGRCDFRPSHFGQALLSLASGSLPALVAAGFDWVDVRDVVEAALNAEERAQAGARYLLSGHWLSLPEVAALTEEITGVRAPRVVCPMGLARLGVPLASLWAALTGGRPLYTSVSLKALREGNRDVSHARASRDLGYVPRPLRETIKDTLEWFQRTGRLARPMTDRAKGAP